MDELKGRRARRLGRRPDPASEPVHETAESVLPDLPRVGALDALLREVDSLRLTLETDLSLAASAVEMGALDVAGDIIDSDRDGLAAFERRALGHVAELAKPRKRRFRVPAAPFVAAAAVAGFLIGVVPQTSGGQTSEPTTTNTAAASLIRLSDAAARGRTSDVVSAASQLHAQLEIALQQAKTDPQAANAALKLLERERWAIMSSGEDDNHALLNVLAASQSLTNAIRLALPTTAVKPPVVRPTTPVVPVVTMSPKPQATRNPPSSPKPTATKSPTPRATTSPAPHSSASPSPSTSSGGNGLPGAPNVG
jgi:hypothetical protein